MHNNWNGKLIELNRIYRRKKGKVENKEDCWRCGGKEKHNVISFSFLSLSLSLLLVRDDAIIVFFVLLFRFPFIGQNQMERKSQKEKKIKKKWICNAKRQKKRRSKTERRETENKIRHWNGKN